MKIKSFQEFSAKSLAISKIGQTLQRCFYYLAKNSFDKILLHNFKQLTLFLTQENFIIYCGINGFHQR